jgi:hypothetical protein
MFSCVIVIPIYKVEPNTFETVSFLQFVKIMYNHPVNLITFKNLDISWYVKHLEENKINYDIVFFDEVYFKNVSAYSTLLLSKKFYKTFIKYNYLLIFQLDVYIFKDSLEYWVQKRYSYIGAPWILKMGNKFIFDGVGNGGFSLRHVKSHLRVLESYGKFNLFYLYVRYCFQRGKSPSLFVKRILFRLHKKYFTIFKEHNGNEDIFWCKVAAEIHDWYTLPYYEEALQFSIETEPRYAFEKNNNQLPFGCHAWEKYDLNFWKNWIKYIE